MLMQDEAVGHWTCKQVSALSHIAAASCICLRLMHLGLHSSVCSKAYMQTCCFLPERRLSSPLIVDVDRDGPPQAAFVHTAVQRLQLGS